MIIGFAHLMVGVEWSSGFQTHYQVPSSPLKSAFMKNGARLHNIALIPGMVPLELVYHDTGLVESKSRIKVMGQSYLHVVARNPVEEVAFLSKLGIVEYNLVRIRSKIPAWCVDMYVDENDSAPLDPPMDLSGYAALAFYSTNVVSDRQMLIDSGGRMATPPFDVRLGGRDMSVVLMRSPEGTIIELVQVGR